LGQDEITYRDPASKKETKISGAIQSENPGQIVVKTPAAGTKSIPVPEVIDVVYNVPALAKPDYRNALGREAAGEKALRGDGRKRELADALAKYEKLWKDATEERPKRHFEFKIARLTAQQAEDDPTLVPAAEAKLDQFLKSNPQAWQVSRAADLLGRLQAQKGDWEAARRTYEALAATPELPPEVRQEIAERIAGVLISAGQFPAAQKKLTEALAAAPAESPQAFRLQMALALCQAAAGQAGAVAERVEAALERAADPELKALAYNTLGDCHVLANRPRDALWDYLWVDVIYHQDKHEHARALYHLAKLFQEFKEEKRAQQFREKLSGPAFAGCEYQRRMAAGK
jgi:hypothetical protein